ncbi:hypothetical protein SCUCBS95973_000944 [Sporothrix curviconia]|uniref:Uncharacterized protein n=1 Tax=Sporothrix curviconia TaxID=1260050 RepID=A0ABP0AUG5_9PEZI
MLRSEGGGAEAELEGDGLEGTEVEEVVDTGMAHTRSTGRRKNKKQDGSSVSSVHSRGSIRGLSSLFKSNKSK